MQTDPLKIISLNIEFDRHLDRIIPFLIKQQPDVVLLQEVLGKDLQLLEKSTNMQAIYVVQNIFYTEKFESTLGLLTLSHLPIVNSSHVFYSGDGAKPVRMNWNEPDKTARAISITEIKKGKKIYRLLNTHFTWTPNAQPSQVQHQDLERLLLHLSTFPEFILCGDFNAPRGGIIFDAIAAKYKDNIPSHISTTIDKQLHRCGDLNIVVDGIFTTPGYEVIDVQVVDSLSDHCGIITMVL